MTEGPRFWDFPFPISTGHHVVVPFLVLLWLSLHCLFLLVLFLSLLFLFLLFLSLQSLFVLLLLLFLSPPLPFLVSVSLFLLVPPPSPLLSFSVFLPLSSLLLFSLPLFALVVLFAAKNFSGLLCLAVRSNILTSVVQKKITA